MNAKITALINRLKALNAQRADVALELAEALSADVNGESLLTMPLPADPEPDKPRASGKRLGRPLSARSEAILRFIGLRKKATSADFAFLGLTRQEASSTLTTLKNRGHLVMVGGNAYALPGASESFAATLKQAVKATKPKPPSKPGAVRNAEEETEAVLGLKGDITSARVAKMLNIGSKAAGDKLFNLCTKRKLLTRVGRGTFRVASAPETPSE